MRNRLVFLALAGIIESFLFFSTNFILAVILLVFICLRVWMINDRHLKLTFLITLTVLGGYFYWTKIQTYPSIDKNVSAVTLYPDEIKVNGDSLSGIVHAQDHLYRFNHRLSNFSEQRKFKNLTQAVDTTVKIQKIESISGPRNLGEFDYQAYLSHRKIFNTWQIQKISHFRIHHSTNLADMIHLYRLSFLAYLERLPKWLKIHAQSLLVGYSSADGKDVLQTLSILGIIHLFSLSGLHVFIIITLIQKACSFIKLTQEKVDCALLLLLPLYGLFVGLKTGITRAIVLALLLIVFKKSQQKMSRLDMFSLTIIICLLIDPFSLIEMGGQLSYLLAGAFIYLKSNNTLVTTVKLNLLSIPIICFYTYQLSWLILLMNLLFVPIFTYLIIPSVILSAIFPLQLAVVWQYLNRFFEWMYSLLTSWSNNLNLNFVTGKPSVVVVLVLLILALYNIEHPQVWNRFVKWYLAIFVATVLFLKFPLYGSVSIIDVGQGDSILITTPLNRKTILIDTGGKVIFNNQGWQKKQIMTQVERSTLPYLRSIGVSNIDQVFLSHKDSDHIGNLDVLLSKFKINQVNFGMGLDTNQKIKSIIDRHPQVKYQSLLQGDHFQIGNGQWDVLWPKHKSVGENGDSLTLLASIEHKNWLFTGDLDIENENKILATKKFHIDYLKVGHHGSKSSTGDKLLKSIQPELGLISAGVNNRYGHPNKETIQRLDKNGVQHLNTADYGMITWYYIPGMPIQGWKTFIRVN